MSSRNQHNNYTSIQTACQLYTNITARWRYGTGIRVFDGTLAEAGEFPWMVQKQNFQLCFEQNYRLNPFNQNSNLLFLDVCIGGFGLFESTV